MGNGTDNILLAAFSDAPPSDRATSVARIDQATQLLLGCRLSLPEDCINLIEEQRDLVSSHHHQAPGTARRRDVRRFRSSAVAMSRASTFKSRDLPEHFLRGL